MRFYVNKYAQPTGEHEVHRSNCAWLPDAENRIYLGSCVDGCKHCCPESHTR